MIFKKNKSQENNVKAKPASPAITPDESVAIFTALYYYLNERHDFESEIITIKHAQNSFSPWNSKHYGLNNTINK